MKDKTMFAAAVTSVSSTEDTNNLENRFEMQSSFPTIQLSPQNSDNNNCVETSEGCDTQKNGSVTTAKRRKRALSGEVATLLPDDESTTATTTMVSSLQASNHNSKPLSRTVPRGMSITNSVTNLNSELTSSVTIMPPPSKSFVGFQNENTSGSIDNTSTMNGASASCTVLHHLEPEGLRNIKVSRRFDEAMLKEVMMQYDQNEDKTILGTGQMISPTIIEDEEEPQQQAQQIEGNQHVKEDTEAQEDSKNPVLGLAPCEHETARQDNAISNEEKEIRSREPPGTPVRDIESIDVVPLAASPPLPLRATTIAASSEREQQKHEYSPTDKESLTPKESPTLEIASPCNEDQQSSRQSLSMPPHAFTVQLSQSVHPAVPLSATKLVVPASGHVHNMNISSLARSSLSSVMSNGYHHATASTTNGMVTYSNGEAGIPHMPSLVLPHSNGGYPGLSTPLAPSLPAEGKRRIHLRLVEDVSKPDQASLFASFRNRSILRKNPITTPIDEKAPSRMQSQWVDRGSMTVSWYEGTSSLELQQHVRNSVIRKVHLPGTTKLVDFRIFDDSVDPPEGTIR
jgi:hypothetical protein